MNSDLKTKNFTLIELLIVLAIIGLVATVALDQSTEVVDQTRYDLTEQNGQELQNAIIGDFENGGRFLRDMGRLPVVISTDSGEILKELWAFDDKAVKWQELSITPDWEESGAGWESLPTAIDISFGWRGPYVNMGSRSALYDGWGNPWAIDVEEYEDDDEDSGNGDGFKDEVWRDNNDDSTITAAVLNDPLRGLKSLGRDQAEDTGSDSWQNKDKKFEFVEDRVFCSLALTLKARDKNGNIVAVQELEERQDSKAYEIGDNIVVNDDIFTVDTAGTSHSSAPGWITTEAGVSTTPEGGGSSLVWLYIGKTTDHPEYFHKLRIGLFLPDVRTTEMGVLSLFSSWQGGEALTTDVVSTLPDLDGLVDDSLEVELGDNFNTILIKGITPGIRKFYCYGFTGDRKRGSFVQTVDLKPGENLKEVILTERL